VIILISLVKSTTGMNSCYYKSEFNFLGALLFPAVSLKVRVWNELRKSRNATEENKLD